LFIRERVLWAGILPAASSTTEKKPVATGSEF
jgi:hypothetical protein